MTPGEIMERLKECYPNMEVMMWDDNNGYRYDIEIEDGPVHNLKNQS